MIIPVFLILAGVSLVWSGWTDNSYVDTIRGELTFHKKDTTSKNLSPGRSASAPGAPYTAPPTPPTLWA